MNDQSIAKLLMHGRSQAVRLPKEFCVSGNEVRIRRMGQGVLLEPIKKDVRAILAKIDSYGDFPFMEDREQPPMPPDEPLLE